MNSPTSEWDFLYQEVRLPCPSPYSMILQARRQHQSNCHLCPERARGCFTDRVYAQILDPQVWTRVCNVTSQAAQTAFVTFDGQVSAGQIADAKQAVQEAIAAWTFHAIAPIYALIPDPDFPVDPDMLANLLTQPVLAQVECDVNQLRRKFDALSALVAEMAATSPLPANGLAVRAYRSVFEEADAVSHLMPSVRRSLEAIVDIAATLGGHQDPPPPPRRAPTDVDLRAARAHLKVLVRWACCGRGAWCGVPRPLSALLVVDMPSAAITFIEPRGAAVDVDDSDIERGTDVFQVENYLPLGLGEDLFGE